MKEHPILFTGLMVRAILEGRKTQTRRPIKAPKGLTIGSYQRDGEPRSVELVAVDEDGDPADVEIKRPFAVGDRLWVRETWAAYSRIESDCGVEWEEVDDTNWQKYLDENPPPIAVYRADGKSDPDRWRPSIHMPRWASRITLEVTGIRPERVKSIPQSDALAEGIEYRPAKGMSPGGSGTFHVGAHFASTAKGAFACLWDSIYGEGPHADDGPLAWQHNPWTWATTFKVVTP